MDIFNGIIILKKDDIFILPKWAYRRAICSYEDCPNYDGKRCKLIGGRPSYICEPLEGYKKEGKI